MANRRKRLFRQIQFQNRPTTVFKPPDSWTDLNDSLPDSAADEMLVEMRSVGFRVWLHPEADGTVRTRMMLPEGAQRPPFKVLGLLSKYSRALGKAVARSGDWQPPQPNPWNDPPLPPGGNWTWE